MGPSGAKDEVAKQWRALARQIADLIRGSGPEVFQQAVRQVGRERLDAIDERERREQTRCEALKKDGVLYRDEPIPEQPEGDWFFHLDILRGSIKLPPEIALPPKRPKPPPRPPCLRDAKLREDWSEADKDEMDVYDRETAQHEENMRAFRREWHLAILPIFEYAKHRGFPIDENGDFDYTFDTYCWLPSDLEPADPEDFVPNESLLPVPRRALTDAEKKTILAAVYDAHWRGSDMVAPWGVSEDGTEPEGWPADAERDEKWAALDYYRLFRDAQQLDDSDLPVVGGWLEDLEGNEDNLPAPGGEQNKNPGGRPDKYPGLGKLIIAEDKNGTPDERIAAKYRQIQSAHPSSRQVNETVVKNKRSNMARNQRAMTNGS